MRYIVLLIFCCLLLAPSIVLASPWLPEKGKFKVSSSIYITDDHALKSFQQESKVRAVIINAAIARLNQERYVFNHDPKLTAEAKANRNQMIDQEIKNLKTDQSYMRLYYPKRQFSQMLEYGVNDKYSLGFKVISVDEVNFITKHRTYDWFQLFQKIKIYQNVKYMFSVQPSIMIYKSPGCVDDIAAEMRFLFGKVKKCKWGKTFNNIEFAHGVAGGSQVFDLNYTTALESKRGNILMFQSFNHFQPKANKMYQKTTLEQISIAKPFIIDNYGASKKITLQAGYFYEFSISAAKLMNRGLLIALWLEI
jgi:hypothetical protein